jgi:hypothetical protein
MALRFACSSLLANKALKAVRVAHWTSFNSAFASQIVRAVSSRPLALRYVYKA